MRHGVYICGGGSVGQYCALPQLFRRIECFSSVIRTSLVLLALPMPRAVKLTQDQLSVQTGQPDWPEILARVAQQDRAAFTTLYDYFAPRIKGWTLRRGADAAQAEDVVQDVMLQIWRQAARFDPVKAAVATWIFTLTRNRYIDIVRKEKHPDLAPDDPMLVTHPDAPDVAYDQRQRADRVAVALRELPVAQRDIITQSFFADMPQQEIAQLTQLPLGTVKSRVRLAFGRLRALLEDMR